MRISSKYLIHDFVSSFVLALLIFTFVMCVGALVKVIDLLARGVSAGLILKAFFYSMPRILSFTIPISTLVTSLLMFSRMHGDHELTAFKACGISLWRLVMPIMGIGLLLTGYCVYINNTLAPKSHLGQRMLYRDLGAEDPVAFLDEGRFVKEFPGVMVYVGQKNGTNLQKIVVYETDPNGGKRKVRAERGEVIREIELEQLRIILFDARITIPDPKYPNEPSRGRFINAKRYPVRLDFSKMIKDKQVVKKPADMTLKELITRAREMGAEVLDEDIDPKKHDKRRVRLWVEVHVRLALAASCMVFSLIGIPLGIGSPRRESAFGVLISLIVMFSFYFFIIMAQNFVGYAHLHPEIIPWIPLIGATGVAVWMIRRAE